MPTIDIDGRQYQVGAGGNLLHACLSLGLDVPYFCWHPTMGSVGACRQCAIKQFKDESDTRGTIAMACMTPVKDGARIAIEDEEARRFRAGVIEFLMVNHPHDCPVCEEGGECHLQDMTQMTGHVYRRFRFRKRTFRNQDLGPCIGHEMNRCITCYRCVRFYRDYAGGRDLHAMGIHDHVYFGRERDGTLESEFSGNLAEVCPTGVFTDKTLSARYTRKWDLRSTPSICVHCALGCNTSPNARYGEVRRIVNRYNGAVNGYFLCDRGRFGYDFVNRADRLRRPLWRRDGQSLAPLEASRAVERFAELVHAGRAIGIGSPRASLEANFALRTLVGEERFCSGIAPAEDRIVRTIRDVLRHGPARTPSLREVEDADAVLVLGEDVPNTAPRLALSLRQAARNASFAEAAGKGIPLWQDASVRDATPGVLSPVFLLTPDATRIDDLAIEAVRAAPDDIARLGFAVAHALDRDAPDADLPEDRRALAGR
ncbi:MAG: NADH-quinone oxidoreductase subunit NuoG, partial [Geminicoccaceae bacterium]